MTIQRSHEPPVATLIVSLRDETARVPLHLPENAPRPESLIRSDGPAKYVIASGSHVRLVQLGNKFSSKHRQSAYLVSLVAGHRLRLKITGANGGYKENCFLCFQTYDESHQFITQFWASLASKDDHHEFTVPDAAAFGCVSLQVAGVGELGDLNVRISLEEGAGREGLEFHARLHSQDDLYALSKRADAAERLYEAAEKQTELFSSIVARWYWERRYHCVIRIAERASSWPVASGPMAHLRLRMMHLAARAYVNLNATTSALNLLLQIQRSEGWRKLLGSRETQRALILTGQALIRNGRLKDGVAALNSARLNDPKHWEPYFLLANNIEPDSGVARDRYFEAAETLVGRHYPKLVVASVENELQQGRWRRALAKSVEGLNKGGEPSDVLLALANVYLRAGDLGAWRRYVSRYFQQFGLTPPRFRRRGQGALSHYASLTARSKSVASPDLGIVAIIMTTFNSQSTLEFSAQSALSQTYGNIKLVIVDDGSSDDTVKVARRLAENDPRITVLARNQNCGTYECKNLALVSTDADFYTFHDSDDWMHPERVARHLAEMSDEKVVCTTSLWFRMEASGLAVLRYAGGYQHVNPASTFIRKEALDRIGYFDCVRTGADTEFLWRLRHRYERGAVRAIQVPLAIGLSHDASLTQSGPSAFNSHRFSEVRLAYWESWVQWHLKVLSEDSAQLRIPYPQSQRPFWAPEIITPGSDEGDLRSPSCDAA